MKDLTEKQNFERKKAQFMLNNQFELKKFFPELYKEKTFSITESQIKELVNIYCTQDKDYYIKELFPEAFESQFKFEVRKWYKDTEYPEWKLFITTLDPSLKKVKGFGFGADGSWMENALEDNWDYYELEKCVEMSEQEVFEALKNEAVKRGFIYESYSLTKDNYLHGDNGNRLQNVFSNGIWETSPTITLSEAEQQLKKKIIVYK